MWPEKYQNLLPYNEIEELRCHQEKEFLLASHWDRYHEKRPLFCPSEDEVFRVEDGNVFTVRGTESTESALAEPLRELLEVLLPWRKGPMNLLGQEIDAEWRSDLKWERIEPHLPELRGRRIGDIGCNNGYYMFRMLKYDPALIVGMDPSGRCLYQFELVQSLLRDPRLLFELFGIEHLPLFEDFFDVLFCLGVIYHRRDP
jgi:tRNA (mo5U34)-methyltransferase